MKKMILGSIVLLVLLLIYYNYNPSKMTIFPKCPFLLLTGLKCPGCGSQRAIHCLLHFDIKGAISYNLLLVASFPIIAILVYAEIVRNKKQTLYIYLHRSKYIWILLGVVISWWVVRNMFDI